MSALFVHYDSTSIDCDEFDRCFTVLDDRGPDGRDRFIGDHIAIGCQHFISPPPSGTPRQLLRDGPYVFAFDGRVDNRHELIRDQTDLDEGMSDLELFATLFTTSIEDSFPKIVGPFFAVAYNTETGRLVCGRDTMGLRHIFYLATDHHVLVSSSPDAILAHPAVQRTPDRMAVAGYLSRKGHYAERSFYRNIDIVGRGSYLVVQNGAVEEQRYHTFTSQESYSRPRPDAFRQALDRAIAARTRGEARPAIALSGGRDSNTIAAILANHDGVTLTTYSHVSQCENERVRTEMRNIERAREVFDLDSTTIPIDDYDFEYDRCKRDYSFGLPILDPYLYMQVQLYREASTDETVVLDGFGGNSFDGLGFHYYDFLQRGDLRQLLHRAYRDTGSLPANLASSILPVVATVSLRLRSTRDPAWLTCEPASSDIEMAVRSVEKRSMLRFLFRNAKSLMRFQARHAALKHGVDLRFPLMDERLHREVLNMPPGSLRAGGRLKGLFLDAVDGLLPPEIEAFEVGMPFNPFLNQGLENYGRTNLEEALRTLHTSTLGIVDEAVVRKEISNYMTDTEQGGIKPIDLWRLLTIEQWLQGQDYQNHRTSAT